MRHSGQLFKFASIEVQLGSGRRKTLFRDAPNARAPKSINHLIMNVHVWMEHNKWKMWGIFDLCILGWRKSRSTATQGEEILAPFLSFPIIPSALGTFFFVHCRSALPTKSDFSVSAVDGFHRKMQFAFRPVELHQSRSVKFARWQKPVKWTQLVDGWENFSSRSRLIQLRRAHEDLNTRLANLLDPWNALPSCQLALAVWVNE